MAWNEAGNAEASDDRDTALERRVEDHGGQRIQVVALNLTVPAPRDLDATVEIMVDEDKVEVAETEAKARLSGIGPRSVKIGRSVRYPELSLREYIKGRMRGSTSEQ